MWQPQPHRVAPVDAYGADRLPRMSTQLRAISLEYSYSELCNATRNWTPSLKLGSGTYGSVYKGELEDGSEVAIKAIDLKALGASGQGPEMAGFEEEVTMLSKFRHPNLVTLLGWCKQDHCRYLIYELLSGGDAFQRLAKSKLPGPAGLFLWHERLSVALDAATGLSHMHNSKPKAFHRDIKSANILLDRHGTAKMADFGLSCTTDRKGAQHVNVTNISGTPGYACPIYSRTGRVTEGSEVYSMGMVILEFLTGLAPASADPSRQGGIAYPVNEQVVPNSPGALERCIRKLDGTAQWPVPLIQELIPLALRCVNTHDERQRPAFVELVRTLRGLGERFPKPLPGAATIVQQPQQLPQPGQGFGYPLQQLPQQQQQHAQQQQQQVRPAGAAYQSGSPGPAGQNWPTSPPSVGDQGSPLVYGLELVRAVGVEPNTLPLERRRLFLRNLMGSADDGGAACVAPVGRQYQPEVFEAWLPDLNLRSCISRTAFEIHRDPRTNVITLVAHGSNPVVVDGQIVPVSKPVPLRLGSEVGFAYAQAKEQGTFLLLRFVRTIAPHQIGASVESSSTPVAASNSASDPRRRPTYPAQDPNSALSLPQPQPQQQIRPPDPLLGAQSARAAQRPLEPGMRYQLECAHAEGLTPDVLRAIPPSLQIVPLPIGATTLVGRQHQPQLFETLLKAAPSRLSLISRTHMQLETGHDGSIRLTNLSSNPLYIGLDSVPKGEPRLVGRDIVLSFARLEGKSHVHFLGLRIVLATDAPSQLAAAPAAPAIAPANLGYPAPIPQPQQPQQPQPQPPQPQQQPPPAQQAQLPQPSQQPSLLLQASQQEALAPAPAPAPARVVEAYREEASPVGFKAETPSPPEEKPIARTAYSDTNQFDTFSTTSIVLELHGEGVLNLPLPERSIGPVSVRDEPLVVGRRHQVELHRRAIEKDCRQFLSRDHFQISWVLGTFKLEALTSNPLWRDRNGTPPIELLKGEPVSLAPGDRIALGTGTDETLATVQEARRKLCWHFRLATPSESLAVAVPSSAAAAANAGPKESKDNAGGGVSQKKRSGHETPPSPGGIGPRVSNIGIPFGRSSGNAQGWEPMLPPAAEVVKQNQSGRDERPSDFFSPSPKLLNVRDKGGINGLPEFGGALRAPVDFDDDDDDYRHDEFGKSGFKY